MNLENQLSPSITSDVALPLESHSGKHVLFSLMDWSYFIQWHDVITIPPLPAGYIKYLGIYIYSNVDKVDFEKYIESREKELMSKGIYFVTIVQPLLENYLQKISSDFAHSLRVNYLRCARFLFAPNVCKKLKDMGYDFGDKYVYILDADHIVIKDLSSEIDKIILERKPSVILAWNSGFYNRSTYISKMSGSEFRNVENQGIEYFHGKPYICIKAGFFAFIPFNNESQLFLRMVTEYSLGGPGLIKMRMFNFYYGDQLALHLAADDLYKYFSRETIDRIIHFIDLFKSNLCNLSLKDKPCIYMPKGSTSENVISEFMSTKNTQGFD